MRITKLDGLRGIFSIMIVFYHYYDKFIPSAIYDNFLVKSSYSFVDFFFVLSGFVISYNYDNKLTSNKDFWVFVKKRFARLFPLLLYTVSLLFIIKVTTLYVLPKYEPDSFRILVTRFFNSILFLNSTPISVFFGLDNYEGINIPSWSISSEMISYIVFGLVSVYAYRKNKNIIFFILIVLSVIYIISKEFFFLKGDNGFIRGIISFNLGYFVFKISKLKFKIKNNFEYLIPITLCILLYLLNFFKGFEKQMFGLYAIPIFFALFILIFVKTNGVISKFLDTKPLQFLGKVSYSVYLNHTTFILVIPTIVFEVLKFEQNLFSEMIIFIGSIIFVLFYSHLTYKYIEVLGAKFIRKKLLKN